MINYEEEYKKLFPVLTKISNIALLGKEIVVRGAENFIKKGPNIIVGNHIGTFKDVATFIKITPRQLFPTSNKMIFDKNDFNFLIKKHLQRHLKKFGIFLDLLLTPIKSYFVNFITTNIIKLGAIPVDLYNQKRMAIQKIQEYLKEGRAVVLLQGRGRLAKNSPNPYVSSFRRGPSIISYNLNKEGISVPVTPVATFGTHMPFLIPGKITVNIGEPIYIGDYMGSGFMETVESFRVAMENRVKNLLLEIIKK